MIVRDTPHHRSTPPWWSRAARPVGWSVLLVAAIVALHRAGGVVGSGPDLLPPVRTLARWRSGDAFVVVFTALRMVALVLAWYLLVTTAVGTIARLLAWRTLIRIADRVTVARLRRFLHTSLGAGALAVAVPVGAILGPGSAAVAQPAPTVTTTPSTTAAGPVMGPAGPIPSLDPPVMRSLAGGKDPAEAEPVVPEPVAPESVEPQPVLEDPPAPSVPSGGPASPGAPGVDPPAAVPEPTTPAGVNPAGTEGASPEASVTAPGADTPATWRIEPGDHLWRVAEITLARRWGQVPSAAQTASYLDRLIEANRSVLAVPDNPDLVFAGQEFSLPPIA